MHRHLQIFATFAHCCHFQCLQMSFKSLPGAPGTFQLHLERVTASLISSHRRVCSPDRRLSSNLTTASTCLCNLLAGLWLGADSRIASSTPSVNCLRRVTSKERREWRSLSPAENNGEPCRETHKGLSGAGLKDKMDVLQALSHVSLHPFLPVPASLWRQFAYRWKWNCYSVLINTKHELG